RDSSSRLEIASLNSRRPRPSDLPASGRRFGPSTSSAITRTTTSSMGPTFGITNSPPECRFEVLDLFDRLRVDAAGEVFPAVVADDEDDVALVHLVRDAHRDARD